MEGHEPALAFLKKVGATFPNFRVPEESWFDKYDFGELPTVMIFRDGKLVTKYGTYEEALPHIEKLVGQQAS